MGSRQKAEGRRQKEETSSYGIEIAIEELVLHGLDPSDRDGIREIIERELERLFRERGVPESLGKRSIARVAHAEVEVPAGSKAQAIGAQVAQSVYGKLADASGADT